MEVCNYPAAPFTVRPNEHVRFYFGFSLIWPLKSCLRRVSSQQGRHRTWTVNKNHIHGFMFSGISSKWTRGRWRGLWVMRAETQMFKRWTNLPGTRKWIFICIFWLFSAGIYCFDGTISRVHVLFSLFRVISPIDRCRTWRCLFFIFIDSLCNLTGSEVPVGFLTRLCVQYFCIVRNE